MTTSASRVVLVKGADPALVAQAAHRRIESFVEGRDPSSCVEEHGGSSADEFDVARFVDALTTPPFLTDRRVVVLREAGKLTSGDADRLVSVLEDLPEGVAAIFVGGGGTVPTSLAKVIGAVGEVVDATVGPSIRDRRAYVAEVVRRAAVRLEPAASEVLVEHVGEDLSRIDGVLETLAAAYGEGASISPDELAPFLGATGSVPEWDLTDAIVAGDAARSLDVLHRLVGTGTRAAPVVVSSLQRHYLRLLRLEGSGARTKEAAATMLKVSAYPAGKLLGAAQALGAARIRQAVTWIAGADADVKGATALEPAVVLEVLVARLARLHRAAGRATR